MNWKKKESHHRTRPNGELSLNQLELQHSFNDFGCYTEMFAVTIAVSEMLLQSVDSIIRMFPAWPRDRDMFKDLVIPRMKKLLAPVKRAGKIVTTHTDGDLKEVIPLFLKGSLLRTTLPWLMQRLNMEDKYAKNRVSNQDKTRED